MRENTPSSLLSDRLRDPQAMTTINRRALVTVAAALVPAPALSGPATHPDAELLGIGEQIKETSTGLLQRAPN
jgi:hypothetical protein